jgi:hypothetical protein
MTRETYTYYTPVRAFCAATEATRTVHVKCDREKTFLSDPSGKAPAIALINGSSVSGFIVNDDQGVTFYTD